MKNILTIIFLSCLISLEGISQITFAKDIAPIIYKNCSNCHRPGEIGPFPLTNYQEINQRAGMIKFVTQSKYMPPWQADPSYSRFSGETFLAEDEISKIANWVDNGTPRGDVSQEPQFPDYPTGSLLGEPDLILEMEESHLHRGNNRDSYYYFVLPNPLSEDKIVKAVEFRPGNSKVVHHALIFEDRNGIAASTDDKTSEYGFESFGGFNGDQNDLNFLEEKQFPPYAPGQKALRYPDGLGQILKAGSDIAVQIHYAPSAVNEMDKSSINFFFADADEIVTRTVDNDIFLPFNLPGGFFSFSIPGGQVRTFQGSWNVTEDLSLMGLFPHAHLLGKEWEVWLEHTNGTKTNLISIPDWDFNWQSVYYFNGFIKAEKGSKIIAKAIYDNTINNPNNPNNPPRFVGWGEGTEDEMYYMPFLFVPYESGDENIIFEDSSTAVEDIEQYANKNSLISIQPNPVAGNTTIYFNLRTGGPVDIAIMDQNGSVVRHLRKSEFFSNGFNVVQFNADNLVSGAYFISILGKNINLIEKFIRID